MDFYLDPQVTFLNHGSFGATPRPVLEAFHQWHLEMEREPVDFFARRCQDLLHQAKLPLAEFLGARPESLAWVQNATIGVNLVAWSLRLGPEDEVLLTDHEYGAVHRNFLYLSRRFGFRLRVAPLPTPIGSPDQVLQALWAAATPATRVVVVSHITSPSALLLPVAEIVQQARGRGILTLIDGAHAPGQVDLDLERLQPDFYVGNLHKWLSAPKAAAFLYVDPQYQSWIEPLVVSWGYEAEDWLTGEPWISQCEMWGTRDVAAFLAVPAALEFHQEVHSPSLRSACQGQIQRWLDELAPRLAPAGYRSPLQMGSVLLPPGTDGPALHRWLWERRIEVPVPHVGPQSYLRASYHSYNQPEQLDRLRDAVLEYWGGRL